MIKINDSKLSIIKLDFTKGDSSISGIDKSKLRYQVVLLTKPGDSAFTCLPATPTLSIPAACKRAGYTEAWVIEKGSTKWSGVKYTGDEKETMLKWTKYLYPAHLDTAEILVRAVGYGNVQRMFYESYGTDLIRYFYRSIDDITSRIAKGTGKNDKKYAQTYYRSKYNILEFLRDIIQAGDVQIYTDPDLIGKYKRISRKLVLSGTIVPDKWCKVIGIVGNRTRANLSLGYETKIEIEVPENEFGVVTGKRLLDTKRSFCIVKDGVVWGKWLGIKTRNTSLVRKMRAAGMIECPIVFSDEYLVDLEKLPAIGKNKTRDITSHLMAKAEANIVLDKLAGAWARRMEYMEKASLTTCPKVFTPIATSDADKFLHGLGIYGNEYIPRETHVDTVSRTYTAYEVCGHVIGVAADPGTDARRYINGDVKNAISAEFLDKVKKDHAESKRTWSEEVEMWETKLRKDIARLRFLKYRFILGKTLKFSNTRDTKVENVREKVAVVNSYLTVFWTMNKSKIDV